MQVLGVAVNDKPAHTEAAIKELGITYPQIINAQNTPAEAYHFKSIPYVLLFAPDGTILLRRTISPEAVEAKLESLLASSGIVI